MRGLYFYKSASLRYSVIIFIILLTTTTCKDKYNFKVSASKGNLSVSAVITNLPGFQTIKLGTTAGPNFVPDPLTGAVVTISDELGNQEQLIDNGDGQYVFTQQTVTGRLEGSYMLDIITPDGEHYQSTSEVMGKLVAKDSVYAIPAKESTISTEGVEISNYVVNVFLDTQLPKTTTTQYLRWAVDEVYCIIPTCVPGALRCPDICYVYQPFSKFNLKIIKTSDYSQPGLTGIPLQKRDVDFTFMVRHFFNVTQYSMNEKAYNYWKNVELISARTGSIFDTPPATIPGNIHNVKNPSELVFGYFEVSAAELTRVFIDRGYIPTDVTTCTWSFLYPEGTPYGYCRDCQSVKGSTITPPSWFF